MKGFILAAGFGQRMLPITHTLPKPLLPLLGIPLIEYSIALLKAHGITDIIINVHHLADVLMAAVGDGSRMGCTIHYSQEAEILGTGGAIKRMHDALDDTFVLINSDIVVDVDLGALIAQHRARGAQATLLLRQPDAAQLTLGRIGIDRNLRVVDILGQKMASVAPQQAMPSEQSLMFTGVHVIEPNFLDYIPRDLHTDIIRYGYQKALSNGAPLYGAICEGFWADAGTPASYFAAHAALLEKPSLLPHIKPSQRYRLHARKDVRDTICMGDDVHLGEATDLQPPVLLGDGVRTSEGVVLGPQTVLGPRVTVGRGSAVRRSVVLARSKIAAGQSYDGMLIGPDGVLPLLPQKDAPRS